MAKIIILIGKTGSGKSTLANVISGTSKFKESGASVSGTKEIQKEEFIENNSGITYAVIDTVGIGDTKLKKEEVLDKIAEAVYLARDGVSQVLFVTNGRFDQFEMATYNLLRTIIFDDHVTKHTTIVRTKFESFEDEEECQADIEKMLTEKELCEIINSCQERIIHVNNSSLESKYGKEEREESRKILLEHLQRKCLELEEGYKPQKLQDLGAEIVGYMEEKARKRKELAEKERKKLEESLKAVDVEKDETSSESSSLKTVKKKIKVWNPFKGNLFKKKPKKSNKNELVIESEVQKIDDQDWRIFTGLKIVALEKEIKELEETKKLIEEIQETEGFIRQKVLNHILHNYDEITQVIGGNAFLSSIVRDNDNSSFTSKLSFTELKSKVEELEKKLQEKGGNDQSLEEIKVELNQKEKELLELKKQLLEDKKILKEWQRQGFNIQQAQGWAEALGNSFNPENDANFCAWLRDNKSVVVKGLSKEEIEQLRNEYEDSKKITPSTEKPSLDYLIDKGGFGEVYYGKWKLQDVAVKKLCISLNNTSKTSFEEEIMNEIDILKSLKNKYIIQYYGVYSNDQEILIIMEYAENGTLTKFINDNKNKDHNWDFNTNLTKQMALGLAYIHHENIIHRDLKSMNILLTNNYQQVKISDFGLSKTKNISSTKTKHPSAVGTIRWMAPELLRDINNPKYSERSDIYALGMVIWEIAAKCTEPFKDIKHNNLIALHITNGERETVPNNTPKSIQSIIQKCWKDNPSERITLKKILEIVENDKLDLQTIDDDSDEGPEIPAETEDTLTVSFLSPSIITDTTAIETISNLDSPISPKTLTSLDSQYIAKKMSQEVIIAQQEIPPK